MSPRSSLTGDPITDALIPAATQLVWAVRCDDPAEVDAALDEVVRLAGQHGLCALALVLAAMVPDDEPPSRLLGWRADIAEYHRLREGGYNRHDAVTAVRSIGKESPTQ